MLRATSGALSGLLFCIIKLAAPAMAQSGSVDFPSIAPGLPEISSGVQFCNKSRGSDFIWVAINHYEDGKWFREGWWKIPFNDCRTVLSGVANRYMYYYAHNGDGRIWGGDDRLCTRSSAFKIESGSCSSEDIRGFKQLDLANSTSFRMTLE